MDNTFRINHLRITIWIFLLLLIGIGVFCVDRFLFQLKPWFILTNYSNIVLTVWQVQATVATITIATTAFIIGRIDTTYYGISVKNLLYVSRLNSTAILSFWEKIVASVIWLAFNITSAILNNIAITFYMLVVTIVLTSMIVIECINVITKSSIFENFAKKIILEIKAIVLENAYKPEYRSNPELAESEWHPSERQMLARNQFSSIISNLDIEISQKIKDKSLLFEDPTLIFYLALMNDFLKSKEAQFNPYMNNVIGQWILLSIDRDYYSVIQYLINASYKRSIDHSTANIDLYMQKFYNGRLPENSSNKINECLYEYIKYGLSDYSDFALAMIRYSAIHLDKVVFSSVINSVINSSQLRKEISRGKVVFVTIAYLYYLTFKEDLIPNTAPDDAISFNDLMNCTIFLQNINNIKKTHSLRDLGHNSTYMFSSLENILNFFASASEDWEYVTLGNAKFLHLEHDIVEFVAFYSIQFFKDRYISSYNNLSLDVLNQIFNYLDENGNLKDKYLPSYTKYYQWFEGKAYNSSSVVSSKSLYVALNQVIKHKLFEEARSINENLDPRRKSLDKLRSDIILALESSDVFLPSISEDIASYPFEYSEILQKNDWVNDQIVFGYDNIIKEMIEYDIFCNLASALEEETTPRVYGEPDRLVRTYTELFKFYDSNNIHVDTSFNFDVLNELEYYENAIIDKIELNSIKDRLKKRWKLAQNYAPTLYIDSSLAQLGFTFNRDSFMLVFDNLTMDDVNEQIYHYKQNNRYLYKDNSNDSPLEFDEDELRNYLSISAFKITIIATFTIPQEKCGFIIRPKEDPE